MTSTYQPRTKVLGILLVANAKYINDYHILSKNLNIFT
ncbi:hypothetical protein NIES4106_17760 [Fischerella sp. NIES-4106]|nr:hypothetical protein NIES4106_17760 [Fischerella sp. NIES-4106]